MEPPPTAERGLTIAEVAERTARGETNAVRERTSRSYADILRENVFTLFNLILAVLVVAVFVAGSPKDALFGLVLVLNAGVGVVQEIRAKRVLDRLTLLSAPRVRVLRDGSVAEVATAAVVRDDVVELRAGDQVPADGVVLASDGLEVDESLLTGEAAPVAKAPGDEVLSGSFALAGQGGYRATRVGEEAYARKLAAEARRFGLVRSELRAGIDRILRLVLWLMVPIGLLTIATQARQHAGFQAATLSTVAALEAMVPQGLVLLTSIAFAVSVIALGRRHVLVSELAAVEVLARVDVVCVDKTGTLTEAALELQRLEPLGHGAPAEESLGALASLESNRTAEALAAAFPSPGWEPRARVAFSSGRKWSGADFGEHGCWVLGAPEVLLPDPAAPARRHATELASGGDRVLLLARTAQPPDLGAPPRELTPAALVVLAERLRPDASETLRYFAEQGVTVRVLSGDAPATVAAVASRVGLAASQPIDARELPDDDAALTRLAEEHTVFGRITPDGKRRVIEALRRAGHTVAMTGDGVNDVPALKAADLGIAMGSGAGAARSVAQVVLLDGRFATLPQVVAEGRRVIGNIERVSKLFITKTVYAVLLAIAVAAVAVPFPFLPRHLTIVGALTIGIPAFFLALAPNADRYRPGFVPRVLRFAVPAGIAAGAATFASYLAVRALPGAGTADARTAATLTLTLVGLWVLGTVARPLTGWRLWLVAAMALGLALVVLVPLARDFFALALLPPAALAYAAVAAAGGALLVELGSRAASAER